MQLSKARRDGSFPKIFFLFFPPPNSASVRHHRDLGLRLRRLPSNNDKKPASLIVYAVVLCLGAYQSK